MKKILLVPIACILAVNISAQSKNPATTKEMQDKIKQAQQQLDQLSPEQKKMMEQMGVSTKAPSMPAGINDTEVKSVASGSFNVPTKNAVLIAAIPKITLTTATLQGYIKTLNDYIEKSIDNSLKMTAQELYSSFKSNKYTAEVIGNSAIGFWAVGQPEIAVYIMGRACNENISDEDILNNLAAMLSMGGAPHRAIPLLEYLSKKYPDNTTISNNLGQAWFYLGETNKANEELEKVVRAFAYHPQANYTQCLIAQSKGNTTQAIDKIKNSLQYSVTSDKINMLRKLGYKIKRSDLRKPFNPDPNPLGLKKFVRPEVPVSYETEIKLKADWDAFQHQIAEKIKELTKAMQPYIQSAAQQAQKAYNQYQQGGIGSVKTSTVLSENMYSRVVDIHLNELHKDDGVAYRIKTAKAKIDALIKDYRVKREAQKDALIKQYTLRADHESELAKKGEKIGYDECKVAQKFSEWVYTNYNKPLEEAYQNYLHEWYLKITEELYWKQFKYTDAEFERQKNSAKNEWLAALSSTRYIETYDSKIDCTSQFENNSGYTLADFDDIHCTHKSTLDFIAYKQIVECGKMRVEFAAGPLSGNFNFKSNNNGKDRFVNGTLETTVVDKNIGKGPLQAGAKAGMGVEFTSGGIQDVYVTAEASVATVTASGRMSLISGSMSGAINGFGK